MEYPLQLTLIPSDTIPTGGLSIMTISYFSFNSAIICCSSLLCISSDGFGGIGPAVTKSRFGISLV